MDLALLIAGVISAIVLVGAWVIYPAWISARAPLHPEDTSRDPVPTEPLTVVIATREPADAIARRVADLRSGRYPRELLDIVVALDYSEASSLDRVREAVGQSARVVLGDPPGSKAGALNAGVRAVNTRYVAFADSAQTFDPATLPRLVDVVARGSFDAVTAQLAPTSGDAMMDLYWRRELRMRRGQAAKHSIICVTGCAYAMKTESWVPIPLNTICDDLWVTYSHVLHGQRVGIAPNALVVDPRRFTREQEYSRRLRTMTGLFQFIGRMPGVLSPRRNPIFLDFVLHKAIRLVTPLLALLVLAAGVSLIMQLQYGVYLLLGGMLLLLLLLLIRYRFNVARLTSDLTYAIRLALIPFHALWFAARGEWNVWRRQGTSTPVSN